jgi:hypothetical protein
MTRPSTAAWLARLAGVGHDMASKIDRAELHWARPELLAIGLVLLGPACWWIARRHRERMPWLSPRLRRTLNACRFTVLGLLVFVIGGPYLALDERIEEKPVVAIVVDESASMDLPVGRLPDASVAAVAAAAGLEPPREDDAPAIAATTSKLAGFSRRELARAVLESQRDTTLRQLDERFEVRRYEVARTPRRHSAEGREGTPTGEPLERLDTALGSALQMAMDDASDRSLAGIVLVSDGRSTTGIDPLEAVRRATEAAGGTPRAAVYPVPAGAAAPPTDLSIVELLAAPEVALDDTVAIGVTLQSQGLAGREVSVELRDADGTRIDARTTTLRDGRQQVAFQWRAARPGTNVLTVVVAPQPDEAIRENNAAETSIDVSARRAKVLVLEHAPRWDLRFIDHAIRRDTGFEATVVLTAALEQRGKDGPDDRAAGVPRDVDGFAAYDLVLLGDVPASVLDDARQRALVEAVTKRGVGLVLQPGGDFLPRDYLASPLEALFPVEIDATAGDGAAVFSAADFKPLSMSVTARGSMHPAFAIGGDTSQNRAKWGSMPPFFRAAAATAAKPSATVLAHVQAPGGRDLVPLVADAPAGNGRVLWIGCDETFRWRRNVGDPLFWRFWGQALRSVARREDRPADASWLVVSPSRCEPGSPVFVELNLVDAERKPVVTPKQQVAVKAAVGESVALEPAGRPGLYVGSFTPRATGRHVVTHSGGRDQLTGELTVSEPTRERAQASVDRDALQALADLSGGAVVEPGEFSTLPYRLAADAVETRASLSDDLWDTWPVLVLLVGLFCLDVGIRRLSGSS